MSNTLYRAFLQSPRDLRARGGITDYKIKKCPVGHYIEFDPESRFSGFLCDEHRVILYQPERDAIELAQSLMS